MLAYQGYGHQLDLDVLRAIVMFATGGLKPDLTLYLDITLEDGLTRRKQASLFGEEWNRLADMELAFHRRVYEGYQALIQSASTP
jgi:dTMP kinase